MADWIDATFYPQDLFGDILNAAGGAVQQVEQAAGGAVQQVEQAAGGAAQQVEQAAAGAAGATSAGVQQVTQEAGSVGQALQQAAGGAISAVEQVPQQAVQTILNVSSQVQQQVQQTQQQASQVLNLLSEAPAAVAGALQQAESTGNTAVVNLLRSAQNVAIAASAPAVAAEQAVQSGAATALAALSAGVPKLATLSIPVVTGTVKAAASGATSVLAPAAPVIGFLKTLGTTVVAGASGDLAGVAKVGAQTEASVPVFQDIYNAGLETVNVAKNIASGQPVFNGITTGTVVATAPGVSKGNITVNALQNVANTPGANSQLFEQIVGPNANPVVLTGAQILDFTITHPLTTTLAVAGAVETGGAALDLLAPGEVGAETAAEAAISSAGENSALEENIIANPNVETTLTEDVTNLSTDGDTTASEACGV